MALTKVLEASWDVYDGLRRIFLRVRPRAIWQSCDKSLRLLLLCVSAYRITQCDFAYTACALWTADLYVRRFQLILA